jgi:hypothetical protein
MYYPGDMLRNKRAKDFIRRCLSSNRPATRRKAEKALKKLEIAQPERV